jgi:hypothetical protein|tara:strand:- start:1522 stop:1821 length:300 start_codon:yes stop_codon:yes gene_type:complete
MKNLIITLSITLLICISCKKEENYMNQAKILEPDYRMCVCCGGWFIKIDNDTLRFYELPSDCNIDLNAETLPIEVELNWEKDKNDCLGDEIIIDAIRKK